eukprot:10341081-Ditylum_brightwellii.AAC.1
MNGPIFVISQILRNVMALAAEAELEALFENTKEAVSLHTTLNKLGHQQQAAPIQVDNSTACMIIELNMDNLKFIGSQLCPDPTTQPSPLGPTY